MDTDGPDLDDRSHGTNEPTGWPTMIAGAICEETDCTGLVLMLLAALAVFVLVATVVALAWAATVSAVLERRGWGPAKRRTAGGLVAVAGIALVWSVATGVSDVGAAIAGLVAILAVPVAIWQRSVTKRYRAGQSSPCSTA
ncbi:MAG: hypothetical protein WCA57_00330 [Ilumatobacteraceae bacterium]